MLKLHLLSNVLSHTYVTLFNHKVIDTFLLLSYVTTCQLVLTPISTPPPTDEETYV